MLFLSPEAHWEKRSSFELYDLTGRRMMLVENLGSESIYLPTRNLNTGMYFYLITSDHQILDSGKLIKRK